MRRVRTLFVHGAGRSGSAAWPVQAGARRDDWVFLSRAEGADDPRVDAVRAVDALGGEPGAIVSASYGGLAALLAAAAAPDKVHAVVLFEPACFSVARGSPAVEAHVAAMARVFAVAQDPDVSDAEFSRRFSVGMGLDAPPQTQEQIAATVPRLRATPPPWSVEVDPQVVSRVPTVVVTGGWSALYDEVAAALNRLGARHLTLAGHGHRPQDHPDANQVIISTTDAL